MTEYPSIVLYILGGLFFVVVPLFAIIAVVKKKVKVGFAIGISISSFLLGLMAQATVLRVDPVDAFMREVNYKNYEEAKRAYKILIQYGPEYLEKIEYNAIIDPDFFREIKNDVALEYKQLAEQYYQTCSFDGHNEKQESDAAAVKEKLSKLKHALKLITFSESIDFPLDSLKEKINERISAGEILLQEILSAS